MTNEQKAAYVNAQVASMLVEMEAMKATNVHEAMQNCTPKYQEKHFLALPEKYGVDHNKVIGLFHE